MDEPTCVERRSLGGRTALGIELGSTRIKAVLIGPDHAPLAVGSHDWENQFVDRRVDLLAGRGLGRAAAVLRRPGRRRAATLRRRADARSAPSACRR